MLILTTLIYMGMIAGLFLLPIIINPSGGWISAMVFMWIFFIYAFLTQWQYKQFKKYPNSSFWYAMEVTRCHLVAQEPPETR